MSTSVFMHIWVSRAKQMTLHRVRMELLFLNEWTDSPDHLQTSEEELDVGGPNPKEHIDTKRERENYTTRN